MILIIGGANQGKLEYAKKVFGGAVENCAEDNTELKYNCNIIYGLEKFNLACLREGIEAKDKLQENLIKIRDKVIVCEDMSEGIVPTDKEMRDLREMNGRTLIWLTDLADSVVRVFAGVPDIIKDEF